MAMRGGLFGGMDHQSSLGDLHSIYVRRILQSLSGIFSSKLVKLTYLSYTAPLPSDSVLSTSLVQALSLLLALSTASFPNANRITPSYFWPFPFCVTTSM